MGGSVKIYQLAVSGHYAINHARYTAYSNTAYRTEEAARAAIPEFFKTLTIPKHESDTMVMEKESLRIFIHTLELINKEKDNGKKRREKPKA